jgi:hypothetical protein
MIGDTIPQGEGDRDGSRKEAGSLDVMVDTKYASGYKCGECVHCTKNAKDNGSRLCMMGQQMLDESQNTVIAIADYEVKIKKNALEGSLKNLRFEFILMRKHRIAVFDRIDQIDATTADYVAQRDKYKKAVEICTNQRRLVAKALADKKMAGLEDDGKKLMHTVMDNQGNFHDEEITEFVDIDVLHQVRISVCVGCPSPGI